MDRLVYTLLALGIVVAGLGAATAVSIYENDAPSFNIPDGDEDLVDEEEALAEEAPRTTAPATPSSEDASGRISARSSSSSPASVVPVSGGASGPRSPRSTSDGAEGRDENPPGSGDVAVGTGPDINDGQGLPANPVDD